MLEHRYNYPAIALVNPPSFCVADDRLEPPLGLLYLASVARENGYGNVTLCDLSGCLSESDLREKLHTLPRADIYGVHCLCTNYAYAERVIAGIRNIAPNAYVLIGGSNPTALPRFTLLNSGADVVVTGEGEDAFVQCIDSSCSSKTLRGIIQGNLRNNIDSIPFPARDLALWSSYSRRLNGEPVVSLLSSRGCSVGCVYCSSVVMGGGARLVRFRSPENLTREIASLRAKTRHFRFNDDAFTANPHLHELLARLAPLNIVFRVFARLQDLTPRTCCALRQAGCIHVAVGLESLDPENLRIIGKARQCSHEGNVRTAKDEGLIVRGYFMVGLPNDSDSNIERYFLEAARLGLDEFSVYPLIPYPGTKLAREPERFGYTITDGDFRNYVQIGSQGRTCFALRHRNFGPEDVERWVHKAQEILISGGVCQSFYSAVAR